MPACTPLTRLVMFGWMFPCGNKGIEAHLCCLPDHQYFGNQKYCSLQSKFVTCGGFFFMNIYLGILMNSVDIKKKTGLREIHLSASSRRHLEIQDIITK